MIDCCSLSVLVGPQWSPAKFVEVLIAARKSVSVVTMRSPDLIVLLDGFRKEAQGVVYHSLSVQGGEYFSYYLFLYKWLFIQG